jgi:hypothetical protein
MDISTFSANLLPQCNERYLINAWYPQEGMTVHPNLQTPIGNISIIYISRNNLVHLFRTTDPIFVATEEIPIPPLNITGYIPKWEERLRAIACIEKLQLCNDFERGRKCSPWIGVVKGEGGRIGSKEFYDNFYEENESDDRGFIGLLFPDKPVGLTVGQTASGERSNLAATRSMLTMPGPHGRLWQLQTARGDELWKVEVSQCT